MPNRVVFLIDGFNLYHSIRDAMKEHSFSGGRWLDMSALCRSYLHLFGRDAVLQDVYYFSALAAHANPQAPVKHQVLISALESTGVKVVLGKFKENKFGARPHASSRDGVTKKKKRM